MITKDFLPAVSTYAAEVSKNAAAKKSFMAAADTASEEALVEKLSTRLHCSDCRGNRTETLIDTSFALEDTQKCAEAFHDQVLAKMEDIRTIASDIEALIPDSILSYPTLRSAFCSPCSEGNLCVRMNWIKEARGVFGIYNSTKDAASSIYYGLSSLAAPWTGILRNRCV